MATLPSRRRLFSFARMPFPFDRKAYTVDFTIFKMAEEPISAGTNDPGHPGSEVSRKPVVSDGLDIAVPRRDY